MAILFLCCRHKNWSWMAPRRMRGRWNPSSLDLQWEESHSSHCSLTGDTQLRPVHVSQPPPNLLIHELTVVCYWDFMLHWCNNSLTGTLSFFTFYFVLVYSPLTMLWLFQVYSKGTLPYIYIYPFSPQTPLPSRLPQNIERSSLCSTGGPFGYPFLKQ